MRAYSQIPVSFAFQSYFDSALAEAAILPQPTNQLIVPSTRREAQSKGFAVGVAGMSDTPVAFSFHGSKRDTGTVFCRPGQIIRPGEFDSFEYGLPFGWLGGGRALIYIAHAPDTEMDLGPGGNELIFHRTRLKIEASAANLPTLKRNWPLHFPWSRATSGATVSVQAGNPIIRVEPTRTLMRLRSQIAANKLVSLVFRGSREFDEASDGTYTLTNLTSTFVEVSFAASTDASLKPYPMAVIPENYLFLACDEGGVTALNLGDATLTDVEIDVVRFGRI